MILSNLKQLIIKERQNHFIFNEKLRAIKLLNTITKRAYSWYWSL